MICKSCVHHLIFSSNSCSKVYNRQNDRQVVSVVCVSSLLTERGYHSPL